MKKRDLTRRDLGKIGLAAWSGALAGALLAGRPLQAGDRSAESAGAAPAGESRWLKEPHLCCGLNTCKGHGKGASNDCAGRGGCATVEAHGCAGENACAGQGPSGDNSCKGTGTCAVPLTGATWKKARDNFEAAMTKAGKKFAAQPSGCPA